MCVGGGGRVAALCVARRPGTVTCLSSARRFPVAVSLGGVVRPSDSRLAAALRRLRARRHACSARRDPTSRYLSP
eukprot:3990871-Prymnesium_polylepis.1